MGPARIVYGLPACRTVGLWIQQRIEFTRPRRANQHPPSDCHELFGGRRLADFRDRAVPIQVLLLREQFARLVTFFNRNIGVLPLSFDQEVFFCDLRHGGGRKKGGSADRGDHQPKLSMTIDPAIHRR